MKSRRKSAIAICANGDCGYPILAGETVWKARGKLYCCITCALLIPIESVSEMTVRR